MPFFKASFIIRYHLSYTSFTEQGLWRHSVSTICITRGFSKSAVNSMPFIIWPSVIILIYFDFDKTETNYDICLGIVKFNSFIEVVASWFS